MLSLCEFRSANAISGLTVLAVGHAERAFQGDHVLNGCGDNRQRWFFGHGSTMSIMLWRHVHRGLFVSDDLSPGFALPPERGVPLGRLSPS
ncbi:hypothetical protein [Candidatus Poriferisodalis sp.]|uniref:hypothetical protein n=1 Tax=Candidatus Poriferisodalis sp. TaxID=3101277 RepID=UPI003B01C360